MLGFKVSHATIKINKKLWLAYGALIAFAIWFIANLVLDYFSHIGVDIPLLP